MSKYKNSKITEDGITFDSKDEMHFYRRLKKLQAEGKIVSFELQPKYELQPKFRTKMGKLILPITYSPDFLVYYPNGSIEVIDVKSMGTATQQGELRRKMFLFSYPDIPLVWISRNLKRATIDGEWILYEDLKKAYSNEKRMKVAIDDNF